MQSQSSLPWPRSLRHPWRGGKQNFSRFPLDAAPTVAHDPVRMIASPHDPPASDTGLGERLPRQDEMPKPLLPDVPVGGGVWRRPDGTLYTAIPTNVPPPTPATSS